MGGIATLDEYDIDELAYEISKDTDDELAQKLREEACEFREVYGCGSLSEKVAVEYHLNGSDDEDADVDCDLPRLDDPEFLTHLQIEGAPLPDRKRLFVRLWDGFEIKDKRAFLTRVDPNDLSQRAAT